MKRLAKWLQAIFGFFMTKVEDPMIMIEQAKRDMQEAVNHNKELMVGALTQRNNLLSNVHDVEAQIERNKNQATVALNQRQKFEVGTPQYDQYNKLALQFAGELQNNQAQLETLKASYNQADAACNQVKAALERQERDFRNKMAQASALKANYKSAQVQVAIQKAMGDMNFEDITSGFGAAQEKITNMQSEAAARTEMQANSLSGKIAELDDLTHDMDAQTALSDLEKQLGFAPTTTTTTPVESLENRLKA